MLMPCGFQPTKILCKAMGSRLPRRTVGCSNFTANARQRQGGHELGLSLSWQQVTFSSSRKGTSFQHNWFDHVVLSRHCSLAVVVDFVCVLRCIRPQTHRCIRLVQETSNTTFLSTNTLFDKTVRIRIIGSGGVKDCVFSQPVVDCAHELPSLIIVETPNSTQQQLHVDHCILDRLAEFVHQRFDRTETFLCAAQLTSILTHCRPLEIFQ